MKSHYDDWRVGWLCRQVASTSAVTMKSPPSLSICVETVLLRYCNERTAIIFTFNLTRHTVVCRLAAPSVRPRPVRLAPTEARLQRRSHPGRGRHVGHLEHGADRQNGGEFIKHRESRWPSNSTYRELRKLPNKCVREYVRALCRRYREMQLNVDQPLFD